MIFEHLYYWLNLECYNILTDIANMKRFTQNSHEIMNSINTNDLTNLLYLETVRLYKLGQKFKTSKSEVIDIIQLSNIDELYSDYKFFMENIFKCDYYNCIEYVDLLN